MINRAELLTVKEENTFLKILRNLVLKLNFKNIAIGLLALLISRASIMDGLTPFGIAFLTAYLIRYGNALGIITLLSLGILSIHGLSAYYYLVVIWLLFFLNTVLKNRTKVSTLRYSVLSFLLLIMTKTILLLTSTFYMYDFIMAMFEGVIVFTLTYIFSYSISIFERRLNDIFTNEEIISAAIMISLAISGLGDITIIDLSLKRIVGVIIILIFAYFKGPAFGTTIGVTIGLITGMSNNNVPLIISVYGFSGLLGGLFKDLGKLGTSLGFIIGNAIMSFYINGFVESMLLYKEIAVSIFIFFMLAISLEKNNGVIFGNNGLTYSNIQYSKRIRDITYKRLKEVSNVFNELASTFKKAAETKSFSQQKDISNFVDEVVNDVCKACSMYKFCWEQDFYTAYHSMFDIMNLIELNGNINKNSLPEYFAKRCLKPQYIIDKCNYLFDIYRVNHRWEKKILESRQLVTDQLEGVATIINDLANIIYKDIRFANDLEKEIYLKLKENVIDVKEVNCTQFQDGKFEILLELKSCKGKGMCLKDIVPIVSKVVGFDLTRDKFSCSIPGKNNRCSLKLIKANRYGAITKVCKWDESFNYVSGDSYTFGENENDYFIALSDGMGIGRKANQESNITISLLEKFLEAGFDKELALKTINSILLLKSSDEMFSTIDMTIIDLYLGKAQFIKIGSAPTFIKRKDRVDIINAKSLPVGILKDVDFQVYEDNIEDGDLIIMMSDGVLDSNDKVEDKEGWMAEIISNISSVNPQKIATEIINIAKSVNIDKNKDDMTVLVTKVWKRR
ncbi:serine/threonine protein phosphatase [Caloranaerobacter sp. TR13]|uniref:stage II sporulation protein E n=1 Tax=Caloranaerobacter sp. TR13 TaxID=1302151 RepID=UPI0006D3EC7C|nr:stage II sporulation protein E [Caloranaerobacter sp. TR13]KPU26599.1 serine/threonine protein phosphatase [Caloranaerobacter sp. TR13]